MKIDDAHPMTLAPPPPSAKTAEGHKVAKEFEAIFLRKMLSGLEKTTTLTGHAPGAGMYGQMVTDSLADAMSEGGGIGLAASLERLIAGGK